VSLAATTCAAIDISIPVSTTKDSNAALSFSSLTEYSKTAALTYTP